MVQRSIANGGGIPQDDAIAHRRPLTLCHDGQLALLRIQLTRRISVKKSATEGLTHNTPVQHDPRYVC